MFILTTSETATPYTIGFKYKNFVESFEIKGCDVEWCQLYERTNYPIKINMTIRKYLSIVCR